jgi:hypothetical protein
MPRTVVDFIFLCPSVIVCWVFVLFSVFFFCFFCRWLHLLFVFCFF